MEYVTGLGEVLWDMLPGGRKLGGAPFTRGSSVWTLSP